MIRTFAPVRIAPCESGTRFQSPRSQGCDSSSNSSAVARRFYIRDRDHPAGLRSPSANRSSGETAPLAFPQRRKASESLWPHLAAKQLELALQNLQVHGVGDAGCEVFEVLVLPAVVAHGDD